MSISVKRSGAYAAALAFVKLAGTYEAASLSAKADGAYGDISGGTPPPPAPGPRLDFSQATNSQYLALVSVGGM